MRPEDPAQEPISGTGAQDSPRSTDREERQRRVDVLSQLAQQVGQPVTVAPRDGASEIRQRNENLLSTSAGMRHGKRWRVLLGVCLIIVVVAGGFGAYAAIARPGFISSLLHPVPGLLSLDLSSKNFSCPSAAAWSPDGSELAVLAQRGSCSDRDAVPTNGEVVLLYDASSGKLRTVLDPTSLLSASNASLGTFGVVGMSWSPDGSWVVLPAIAAISSSSSSTPVAEPAAVLLSTKGGQSRLLRAAASLASESAFVWDVHSGTLASQIPYPLPPALSYRWTADGHTVPGQTLPSDPASGTLTGSPMTTPGSDSFSLWQPGAIRAIYASIAGQPTDPVDVYAAPFSAWSPDSRYVAPLLVLGAAPLVSSSPSEPANLTPGSCADKGLPPCVVGSALPYPDRAFAHVAALFGKISQPSDEDFAPVAWSPDGKRLATMLPGDNFSRNNAGGSVHVSVLDTTTGEVVHTFSASSNSQQGIFPTNTNLFWSSTGQQLALMDTYSDTVTIWGGSSLTS